MFPDRGVLIFAMVLPVFAASQPRHAPNMYIDWASGDTYDVLSVDWRCDVNADGTYWAVHN